MQLNLDICVRTLPPSHCQYIVALVYSQSTAGAMCMQTGQGLVEQFIYNRLLTNKSPGSLQVQVAGRR
jgi:hypothetical protein